MDAVSKVQRNLERLRVKHTGLHSQIEDLTSKFGVTDPEVERLKKKKLALKDQIAALSNQLKTMTESEKRSATIHELLAPRSVEVESVRPKKVATG